MISTFSSIFCFPNNCYSLYNQFGPRAPMAATDKVINKGPLTIVDLSSNVPTVYAIMEPSPKTFKIKTWALYSLPLSYSLYARENVDVNRPVNENLSGPVGEIQVSVKGKIGKTIMKGLEPRTSSKDHWLLPWQIPYR